MKLTQHISSPSVTADQIALARNAKTAALTVVAIILFVGMIFSIFA